MDSRPELEPQKIGNWVRISVLGTGSFGSVTLWRCCETNDQIAIKKCKFHCSTSITEKQKKRWENEVDIMKDFNHPNIVKYKPLSKFLEKELNKHNPTKLPLLPMEYCQQGNLRHLLTQPLNMCGLEEENVKYILSDITKAVRYLHSRNVTHRDIKPENIVLQKFPERKTGTIYKLIDLGYAKELNSSTISFVGTFHYLAPEILANKFYDSSVDYWSLGILTFEIICGVLPFMIKLSPTERYRLVKEKASDQICVFRNHSGNYQYSSELLKENKLTSCFKTSMEEWIRKALQFNSHLRKEPFANSKGFFEQIDEILATKIVEVFVVREYKFHSYKFDENTTWGEVRMWLAKDARIPVEEQILLGNFPFELCNDQTLLADCFTNGINKLFLFKRDTLFELERHHLPRLVKLMFDKPTATFHWNELKAIYTHSIFYIQQDITLATAFLEAMNLYLTHLSRKLENTQEKYKKCQTKFKDLVDEMMIFNNVMSTTDHVALVPMLQCLDLYDKASICIKTGSMLSVNMRKWTLKFEAMKTINLRDDLVKLSEIKEYLDKAVVCLQTKSSESNKEKMGCREMLRIICKVTKLKDNIFVDKNLKDYAGYLGKTSKYLDYLWCWLDSYIQHMSELQRKSNLIVTKMRKEGSGSDSSLTSALVFDWVAGNGAIERSQELSLRQEELLAESMTEYRTVRDDIKSYIEEISSLLVCDNLV